MRVEGGTPRAGRVVVVPAARRLRQRLRAEPAVGRRRAGHPDAVARPRRLRRRRRQPVAPAGARAHLDLRRRRRRRRAPTDRHRRSTAPRSPASRPRPGSAPRRDTRDRTTSPRTPTATSGGSAARGSGRRRGGRRRGRAGDAATRGSATATGRRTGPASSRTSPRCWRSTARPRSPRVVRRPVVTRETSALEPGSRELSCARGVGLVEERPRRCAVVRLHGCPADSARRADLGAVVARVAPDGRLARRRLR